MKKFSTDEMDFSIIMPSTHISDWYSKKVFSCESFQPCSILDVSFEDESEGEGRVKKRT